MSLHTDPTAGRTRLGVAALSLVAALGMLVVTPYAQTSGAESKTKPSAEALDTLNTDSASLDSLESKANRHKLSRMLSDYVFTPTPSPGQSAVTGEGARVIKATEPYEAYTGKIIRRIILRRLDVFTGVREDTVQSDEPWLYRVGDAVHADTRTGKIMSYLLFKVGEPVEPNQLADSERLLRNTPFIQDARVAIIPPTAPTDSVDVLVVTRDLWSLGLTASASTASKYKVSIFDRNLFGFGHGLENEFDVDLNRNQPLNYTATYTADNVYGTFINGLFQYRNTNIDETLIGTFSKGFITPQTRWAGQLLLSYSQLRDEFGAFVQEFGLQDFWLGRAFEIPLGHHERHSRRTLVLAGRLTRTDWRKHPDVPKGDRTFTDRTLYLASLSLAKNTFRKARLVLGFGTTEDIPSGYLLSLTAGYELARGVKDREYTGIGLRAGRYIGKPGYLIGSVDAGGYLFYQNYVETIINTQFGYFTHLIPVGRFALRQFLAGKYIVGIRNEGQIELDDESGIPGLNDVGLVGTERATVGAETVLFTPWNLWGFKTAFFGQVDVGGIGPDPLTIAEQRFYTSWGLGARISNERLVFDPIEIRVNYYPGPPSGQPVYRIFFTNVDTFPILGFAPGAPSVVGFD